MGDEDYSEFEFQSKTVTVRAIRKNDGDILFVTLPRRPLPEEIEALKYTLRESGLVPAIVWADLSDLAIVTREELAELRDTIDEVLKEE